MNPRVLARSVLSPDWSLQGSLIGVKPHDVRAAIQSYETSLIPLKEADPHLADPDKRSDTAKAICIALRPTGAKLAPHLSPAQASAWVDAVLLSLSKWPPAVALGAARGVVHEPFGFLGDVDAKLHELAGSIQERHRHALHRLRCMLAEIDRAANPPLPQLAPPQASDPVGLGEARGWTRTFLDAGLRNGFLEQETYDQVIAERQAAQGVEIFARIIGSIAAAEEMAREAAEEEV